MTLPSNSPVELPVPSEPAQAHSLRLVKYIQAEAARQGGHLGFDRFMDLALYAPALGYYAAGLTKFGESGDFVTAPEISPLFARCLARQCQQILATLPQANILEFGAGTGILAADLLLALEKLDKLPGQYDILELSTDLQTRQYQTIKEKAPHLLSRVTWLNSLPENYKGIIIANEVLDAMPVKRFTITDEGPMELQVTCSEQGFDWFETPAAAALAKRISQIPNLAPGYRSEVNLQAEAWVHSLAHMLSRGVVLLIDYGYPRHEYYHPQRMDGTLRCHYQHLAHADPFVYPGLQDITAHVDFTAMANAALTSGFDLMGFTNQASFLIGAGLEQVANDVYSDNVEQQMRTAQEIRRLTLPGEMGEAFKVMALGKQLELKLMGFEFNDLRWRLGEEN